MSSEFVYKSKTTLFKAVFLFPEPLAKSGKIVDLADIVGMMPITLMLKIFFGNKFVDQNIKKVEQLTKDSHSIMDTVFYNKKATTAIYKFFDTESNRYGFLRVFYKLL